MHMMRVAIATELDIEHLEGDDAERVDVDRRAVLVLLRRLTVEQLGRHVLQRLGPVLIVARLHVLMHNVGRNAADLNQTVLLYKYSVRSQLAMNNRRLEVVQIASD